MTGAYVAAKLAGPSKGGPTPRVTRQRLISLKFSMAKGSRLRVGWIPTIKISESFERLRVHLAKKIITGNIGIRSRDSDRRRSLDEESSPC